MVDAGPEQGGTDRDSNGLDHLQIKCRGSITLRQEVNGRCSI